ncbi:hypothetical protein BDC45DRAFT_439142 [Circinella umbellata]|nr:hypothetical protein BDC45DRAFT_439142 [Circinella umbellata]
MTKRIVIIGAGIVGLSTALALQEKGYRVVIVAKWLPGDMHIDYTSPWAGAHWRTMAPNSNKLLQDFDAGTYHKFFELSKTHPQETGIMAIPATDFYDELVPDTQTPWFQTLVKDVRESLTNKCSRNNTHELPPGAKIGHRYTTGPVGAVVNCTGLGARYLDGVNDTKMFPTRGQTVIAYAPHVNETVTYIGSKGITYIIPRSNGQVVLGGTANKHDFNPNVEKATIESILERTQKLYPKLTKYGSEPIKVIGNGVGLRPSRVDGPRIEPETYTKSNGKKMLVIHAYGHGGFGYQSSWGAAQYTSDLVDKNLKDRAKL